MKKGFFAMVLCVLFALPATAQKNYSFRDRLFFGGSFGLTVGDYTDIELSPLVGYYITSRWAAGFGVTYEYYNNKYHFVGTQGYERFETHIWGGRLFTNYVIVNNVNDWIPLGLNFRIFAHIEEEVLRYENRFFNYYGNGHRLQNSILAGGGLRFPMGKRSSMNLTLLWNLNSTMNSIYGNGPVIRFGFNF